MGVLLRVSREGGRYAQGTVMHPEDLPIRLWREVTVPWDFKLPSGMVRAMGDSWDPWG